MKLLEPRDLKIALVMLGMWPVAWLMPERRWPSLCALVTGYKRAVPWAKLPDEGVVRSVLGEAFGAAKAGTVARDLDMHRHLLRLEILKCLSPRGWHPRIEVAGLDELDAALERGRGVILWMSHFIHNGLAGKIALHEHGYRVHHLSRPEHGFSKTRLGIRTVNRVRVRAEDPYLAGRIVIDRRQEPGYMKRMLAVLSGNGIVSITAGAWEGRRLVEGRILGRRVLLANGAPAIAHRTGAALLPVVGYRQADGGGFGVEILSPIPMDRRSSRASQEACVVADFLARIEPWVRRYPEQWRSWSKLR